MRRVTKKLSIFILGVIFTFIYCEYLIYYIVAAQCSWPDIVSSNANYTALKSFILADTHLLGPRRGHWLDKWRREWQMHQAYKAIVTLHKPDVIFVLGDLFDEGEWSTQAQFEDYVDRFHKLFVTPNNADMYVVAGNHDIGFHHAIRKGHAQRFVKMLNSSLVQFISIKENHFVLLNSMAMHGDRCNMCTKARDDVIKIAGILKCAEKHAFCTDDMKQINYSRPILMQHFPLYRKSDAECDDPDAPPLPERNILFRTKLDSLSLEATKYLVNHIKPRAVFGGHTHHGCLLHHTYKMPEPFEFYEYSVPSFSWRNRPNPKYMLVTFTPSDYSVNKCGLPSESTIIASAVIMITVVIWLTRRTAPVEEDLTKKTKLLKSDAECDDPDAPPLPERNILFRTKLDSLSLEATKYLVNHIKPRAVFGGHTHHGCLLHHTYKMPEPFEFYEYSVPSFSWRNRPNPKYMLVTFTPSDYSVNKCGLPSESTIIASAVIMITVVIWLTRRTAPVEEDLTKKTKLL